MNAAEAADEVYRRARTAQAAASAAVLAAPAAPAELVEGVAAEAWGRADALAAASPARASYACAKGCRWCCHQPILVAAPEAIALANALRETLPRDGLATLGTALAARARRAAEPGWERAWLAERVPCAFLAADGACSVHPFRPAVCRGWHSLSRQACAERYADDAAPVPPIDRASHLAANGVLHGLGDAAAATGRDPRLYELSTAVLAALADPAAAARWTAGGATFVAEGRDP